MGQMESSKNSIQIVQYLQFLSYNAIMSCDSHIKFKLSKAKYTFTKI